MGKYTWCLLDGYHDTIAYCLDSIAHCILYLLFHDFFYRAWNETLPIGISRTVSGNVISVTGVSSYWKSMFDRTIFMELTAIKRPGHACLSLSVSNLFEPTLVNLLLTCQDQRKYCHFQFEQPALMTLRIAKA